MSSIEEKESSKENEGRVAIVQQYRQKVETELKAVCHELIALVDGQLLPNAKAADTRIFYFKMKGDYFRYLAEFATGAEHKVRSCDPGLVAVVIYNLNIIISSQYSVRSARSICVMESSPTHILGGCRWSTEGVPSCDGDCCCRPGPLAPHPPRTCPQLLCFLL